MDPCSTEPVNPALVSFDKWRIEQFGESGQPHPSAMMHFFQKCWEKAFSQGLAAYPKGMTDSTKFDQEHDPKLDYNNKLYKAITIDRDARISELTSANNRIETLSNDVDSVETLLGQALGEEAKAKETIIRLNAKIASLEREVKAAEELSSKTYSKAIGVADKVNRLKRVLEASRKRLVHHLIGDDLDPNLYKSWGDGYDYEWKLCRETSALIADEST